MPVFNRRVRNQGTTGTTRPGSSAEEIARRQRERLERRQAANATVITPQTQPIAGRVTYPNGAIVSVTGQNNVSTAPFGTLGGPFGNVPGRAPGAFDVPLPPGYGVTPQISAVNPSITAVGGYKYSVRPGTGGSPQYQAPAQNSLIGTDSGGGGNYYANSEFYTTLQSAEEAQQKYSTDTTAGAYVSNRVQGTKWRVVTKQLPNGQWVKLTIPEYRGRIRKTTGRSAAQTNQAYQTPQAYQNSVFNQVMSWRVATG